VATTECPVPDFFKERVCTSTCEETLLLGKDAMPIRVLRNRVTAQVAGMSETEADKVMVAAGDMHYVQEGGDQETAVMPCGQSVGVIRRVLPVREVVLELVENAVSLAKQMNDFFNAGTRQAMS